MNTETEPYDPDIPYVPTSRWPLSFEIISIVFGVFGLLASLGQIAQYTLYNSGFMSKAMTSSSSNKKSDEMIETVFSQMEKAAPKVIAAQGILAVLALVLLLGGILLLMRRRIASPVIQTWAVLKLIGGGFAVYIGWQVMNQMQAGMFAQLKAGSPAGASTGFAAVGAVYMAIYILQFLWLAALPVFFLVWLNRDPIKDDLKDGVWK